jgi:hypothetical protein
MNKINKIEFDFVKSSMNQVLDLFLDTVRILYQAN